MDILMGHLEMLVLDDSGERNLTLGVVHDCNSLMIRSVENFRLETHRAVLEGAETVAEIFVYLASEDNPVRNGLPLLSVVEEIHPGQDVAAFEQAIGQAVVASLRDSLPDVVEVVVVEHEPDRKTADDEWGKLRARPSPLLLGVALDQLLVNIAADQQQGLLLKVARLAHAFCLHRRHSLCPLLLNPGPGLVRSNDPPHLGEGVHVERQVVQPALVESHRSIDETPEGDNRIDEIPDFAVGGVEYVGAVAVHIDALD